MAFYVYSVYGFFTGASLCVIFAIISFARNETHRVWAAIPALVMVFWGLSKLTQQWQSARDFKSYRAYIEQLKADPEIALREHWPSNRATVQSRAFFDAVWAPYVEFSASQVERIYAEMPEFREVVFNQVSCTPGFIRAHFDEAPDLARKKSPHMLEKIVHNRNTPIELLQRVIFYRKQLPFEPPHQAERISSHPVLGYGMSPEQAFGVLRKLLAVPTHRFVG